MTLTNNKENVRYLFYTTVGGIPKSVKFEPLETIEIADLESEDQIIYNSLDYKLKSYNERFGTEFEVDFEISVAPSALIQTWYDSLTVKPSNSLLSDLNTLVDGMNSDGDYVEMDVFGMIACMETDEQRLKPFKTSANEDFVKVGAPTFDDSGAVNPVPGNLNYIDMRWNPFDNGVKYTLNSAFFGVYGDTIAIGGISDGDIAGTYNNDGTNGCYVGSSPTSAQVRGTGQLNGISQPTASKAGLLNAAKRFFIAGVRTGSTSFRSFANGNYSVNDTNATSSLLNFDLVLLGVNIAGAIASGTEQKIRTVVLGSGNINPIRVASRLNTFFSDRGLIVSNY